MNRNRNEEKKGKGIREKGENLDWKERTGIEIKEKKVEGIRETGGNGKGLGR
jgi:hypothetical protein